MRAIGKFLIGLLLSGIAAHGVASDTNLFRFEGKTYSADQASAKLRTLLYDLELQYYEQRQALADEVLFELYVDAEAAKRGVSTAALRRELLDVAAIQEDELRAFYDANAARINQPYDQMRERIRQHLRDQQLRDAKLKVLAKVKEDHDFEMLTAPPESPPLEIATDGYPRKGAKAARFTIVEFGDYQCPHCGKAAQVLHRLVESHPEDVQVIYMDFPINRSGISRIVAEGAACALRQEKFWPYHDLAYERQSELNDRSPMAFAKILGLDEVAFAECITGRGAKAHVARSADEARRLGLSATPSIFVNGRPLRSRHLERDLQRLIDGA